MASRYLNARQKQLEEELRRLSTQRTDEEYFRAQSEIKRNDLLHRFKSTKSLAFDTVALQGIRTPSEANDEHSNTLPLYLNTAGGSFAGIDYARLLLAGEIHDDENAVYTRIDNYTTDQLAWKVAALEAWKTPYIAGGLCTSSGMAAINMATAPLLRSGQNFVSSNRVYGGTQQLFGVSYARSNFNVRWVNSPWNIEEWQALIDRDTQFLYVETPSNPYLYVANIRSLADLAHSYGIPLIVDSTLASPALVRPFEHGADIVVHSASKIFNGSMRAIGGVLVAREHIVCKDDDLGEWFAHKVKGGVFRNQGPAMSPYNAMIIWDELATLQARVAKLSKSAGIVAKYLEAHPKIASVKYPGLLSHPQHDLAEKTMRLADTGEVAHGFLLSFDIKGGLDGARRFSDNLSDIGIHVTHLGGNSTVYTHNWWTTHGQMSEDERLKAGVTEGTMRMSVGYEDVEDILNELDHALSSVI